jgi:N-acetyl-gamma-glutamyl-phosphate reductase
LVKVGIVGASGYTGFELLRILSLHPEVEITYLTAERQAGKRVCELYPGFPNRDIYFEKYKKEEALEKADFFFLALPHGASQEIAGDLYGSGRRIVDLSADFRLPQSLYERWYGKHKKPQLIEKAVYGLPEIYRKRIKKASLVANPGCYSTASILALAPLVEEGLLEEIIIDAKSGISGAGRKVEKDYLFSEREENLTAYALSGHRHLPEIENYLKKEDEELKIIFVPHLVPQLRGILITAYVKTAKPLGEGEIYQLYQEFYQGENFIILLEPGVSPQTKAVFGSNYCHLGFKKLAPGRVVIFSVLDNLVKGASGQAVQNFNLMLGFPEKTALSSLPLFP